MPQVIVLYPQPTDAGQFEIDYVKHMIFFHEKTGIPETVKPYTRTKFLSTEQGISPFYRMFCMPFESPEALRATLTSPEMQEVAADANRISTGGPITVLIGDND